MKKLVLDLDETLVFSTMEPAGSDSLEFTIEDSKFYSMIRPGVQPFLEFVRKHFECTLWSTGVQPYVECMAKHLGISDFTIWGRDYCKRIEGSDAVDPYEKPLRKITENLTEIVIVDNSPTVFNKWPQNGILVRTWRGEPNDTELEHLMYYLAWLEKQRSMQRDHQSWRIETLCLRSK
ncbi:MAG: HAD family hydrolase [Proteobacteria bacterium]|nr:HAD family hydrolase [Pseudomonadota bacterium]